MLALGVAFLAAAMVVGRRLHYLAMVISLPGVICYGTAWSWLLYGRATTPAEALSELDSAQWVVFAMLMVVPVAVVLGT